MHMTGRVEMPHTSLTLLHIRSYNFDSFFRIFGSIKVKYCEISLSQSNWFFKNVKKGQKQPNSYSSTELSKTPVFPCEYACYAHIV